MWGDAAHQRWIKFDAAGFFIKYPLKYPLFNVENMVIYF